MKFKLRKLAIPVIIAGVIFYGGSKIGNIKDNNFYNEKTSQVELEDENKNVEETTNNNVKEEKESKEETTKVRTINGFEVVTKKVVKASFADYVRSDMSNSSDKLTTLKAGESLDYIPFENENWYKVKYNEKEAYILKTDTYLAEKTQVNAPLQKMVYFTKDSKLYNDNEKNEIANEIPRLESAEVYGEFNDTYLALVDNNVGLIEKKDTAELKGNYAIVDLSDQTIKLYKGNELILTSPVVTGKLDTPTTTGLRIIWLKEAERFLKGEDYSDFVKGFLAMEDENHKKTGQGLHDAEYKVEYDSEGNIEKSYGWRSKDAFGGELYKKGGSHGCVNIPHEPAVTIYNTLEIGDKVLVKQ